MSDGTTRVRRFRPDDQTVDLVPCVEIMTGPRGGERVVLEPGQNRLGRAPHLELAIDEDGVSRLHADLNVDEHGLVTLVDRDSTNGTFVNGARTSRIALRDGDRIHVGSHVQLRFVYRHPDELQRDPARRPVETTLLSARELEVAHLVAEGHSNDNVAAHLGISARTVGKHLSNIYGKLGIHTRAELTRWLLTR